jgi:hypothetical protein
MKWLHISNASRKRLTILLIIISDLEYNQLYEELDRVSLPAEATASLVK